MCEGIPRKSLRPLWAVRDANCNDSGQSLLVLVVSRPGLNFFQVL
jgi:hypothetical protein